LWFDTHGANYTNNFALGWDACYFWMLPFLPNTFFRGQNDPGDCSSTLDASCIADLKKATESASHELLFILPNSGPYSNLNATSLPGVCNQIASIVNMNFPSSCAPFFNGTGSLVAGSPYIGGGRSTSHNPFTFWYGNSDFVAFFNDTALTGSRSLVSNSQCQTKYGSLMFTEFGAADVLSYTLSSWWVTALLTTFMPIADASRPAILPVSTTVVNCLRADKVAAGAYSPSAAPTATPLSGATSSSNPNSSSVPASSSSDSKSAISAGAIVGIVIGAIACIIIGLLVVFFLRRRRQRQGSSENAPRSGSAMTEGNSALLHTRNPSEAPNSTFYEMSSHEPIMELGGKQIQAPVELPAHVYDHSHPSPPFQADQKWHRQ
jgi:hypothetical protein